ncbi:hypothetical protein Sste5346_001333 [Sporothrix stenoceras]|uniref:Rhodopsin domain-containing protein n=1 Tax=Sporothrix stenoceras TaxID=5173 RepID=A0ABR3ZQJ8_9PEZI
MSATTTAASVVASTLATLTSLTTDLATATSTTDSSSPTSTSRSGHAGHNGSHAGHRPNDSRRGVIIGVISFILPFTTAVVLLRFYTRHYLSGRAVGVDDWAMLAALVLAAVDGATMLLMTTQGLGRHMWTLTAEQITTYNMYFYMSIVFYYACLGTVKTAILLQYLRVFAVKMRKITLVALVLIGLWSTALVLVSIFACWPIRAFWDKSVTNPHCVADLPQWYANAAGNIATDILIFALPIPVLWRLNLPRSQRLSLIGIFGLGFFTCTISVIRITFLNLNGDDTYANVAAACWSIGELCCAIVCSSLPTLRPVFFHLLPGPLRHHYNNHSNNTNNNRNDTTRGGVGNGNNPNMYRPSSHHRQSAYLNAYANSLGGFTGFGHDLDHAFSHDGYRLKSVVTRDTNKPTNHDDDSTDGIRRSRTMIIPPRPPRPTSYYNPFSSQIHPAEQPRATEATDKVGLSFTTTSHLRSTSSLGSTDSDSGFHTHDLQRGRSLNRNRNRNTLRAARNRRLPTRGASSSGSDDGMDSDSDLDRYMQWAGRDYYQSQHYHYRKDQQDQLNKENNQEKKAITTAVAAAASPTTLTTSSTLVSKQPSLPTTPSHRLLRELVSELTSPRTNTNGGTGLNIRNSSSTETLGQAAREVRLNMLLPETPKSTATATDTHQRNKSGATFFLSDDEDDANHSNNTSSLSSGRSSSNSNNTSNSISPKKILGGQSLPSSAAPTRAHSPSPSLPPPSPPRSYSYSHLKRMAAAVADGVSTAVNAGIGVAGTSGSIGAGAIERKERERERGRSSSAGGLRAQIPKSPTAALAAPAIAPPMPSLNPADPLAIDRDAYLGLRQGTVTSIEATRPSTAEAEALGLTLPTGPGIQIRREVAQDVGPA